MLLCQIAAMILFGIEARKMDRKQNDLPRLQIRAENSNGRVANHDHKGRAICLARKRRQQTGYRHKRSAQICRRSSIPYRRAVTFDRLLTMARETAFIVQSFEQGRGKALKADKQVPCKSADAARRMAEGCNQGCSYFIEVQLSSTSQNASSDPISRTVVHSENPIWALLRRGTESDHDHIRWQGS